MSVANVLESSIAVERWGGGTAAPAIQKAIRLTPLTTSKWPLLLNTANPCWRASAAIQTSFGGIGAPSRFNSRRMSAYASAVAELTVAISVSGR